MLREGFSLNRGFHDTHLWYLGIQECPPTAVVPHMNIARALEMTNIVELLILTISVLFRWVSWLELKIMWLVLCSVLK